MKLKIKEFSNYLVDFSVVNFQKSLGNKVIILDVGCGEGEFIVELASRHPGKEFLGVEIKYGRIIKCLRRTKLNGLSNLKFALCDATIFIEKILPSNSLNKVFINNPDPWPKEKHQKNKLIRASFLKALYSKMKRKGALYIKTDSREYFEKIKEDIKKTKFSIDRTKNNFDSTLSLTKFQELYKKEDRKILGVKLIKK
jgi:tRNA (guanine-N7-)-methyltransferase